MTRRSTTQPATGSRSTRRSASSKSGTRLHSSRSSQRLSGRPGNHDRLFAHVSDADMTRLGIDENTRTIARLLTSEAHLDAMQHMIPEAQYNAL